MSEHEYSSVITIKDGGPITLFRVPVLDDGGVVILEGGNGTGKSTTLNAAAMRLGKSGTLPVRDGAMRAEVDWAGGGIRYAKRISRYGAAPEETGIVHLEDRYDLGSLVDPGFDDEEAADRARIKALIQLSGVQIPFEQFAGLLPPSDNGHEPVSIESARELADPVQQAGKVKRELQAEIRRLTKLADKSSDSAAGCESAAEGVDVSALHERAEIQRIHAEAVSNLSRLEEQDRNAKAAREAREKAKAELREKGGQYDGPSAEEAAAKLQAEQDNLAAKEAAVAECHERVERLRAELKAAEAEEQQAVSRRTNQANAVENAEQSLKLAQDHERLITELSGQAETELPAPVPPEEMEAARRAKAEADDAVETGVKVREALRKLEEADKHKQEAEKHRRWAKRLQEACDGVDDILSKAVRFDNLRVEAGRLIYQHEDGRTEPFARLSPGQRARVGAEIGAKRVSEQTGDGTRLMIIRQEDWAALDGAARNMVNDIAVMYGITVVTAQVSERGSSPLRVLLYETGEELVVSA